MFCIVVVVVVMYSLYDVQHDRMTVSSLEGNTACMAFCVVIVLAEKCLPKKLGKINIPDYVLTKIF